jgi:DNA-binding FadR family transcriptional regulator
MFHGGELTLQYFYEARRAIECAIIRLAVEKAKPKDLKRLRQINAKLLTEIEERGQVEGQQQRFPLGRSPDRGQSAPDHDAAVHP